MFGELGKGWVWTNYNFSFFSVQFDAAKGLSKFFET
jgi:hypothetical protein